MVNKTLKVILPILISWIIFGLLYHYEDHIVSVVTQHGGAAALAGALVLLLVASHIVAPFGAWPFMLLSFSSFGVYGGTLLYTVALAISTTITFYLFGTLKLDGSKIASNGTRLAKILSSPASMSVVSLSAVRAALFLYPDFLNYYLAALRVPARAYFVSAGVFLPFAFGVNAFLAEKLGATDVQSGIPWAVVLHVLAYGGLGVAIALVVIASYTTGDKPGNAPDDR